MKYIIFRKPDIQVDIMTSNDIYIKKIILNTYFTKILRY